MGSETGSLPGKPGKPVDLAGLPVPNIESLVFTPWNLSRPGFEPWTFGLVYLRANHEANAARHPTVADSPTYIMWDDKWYAHTHSHTRTTYTQTNTRAHLLTTYPHAPTIPIPLHTPLPPPSLPAILPPPPPPPLHFFCSANFFCVRFFRYQLQQPGCRPLFSSDLPGCRRACRPRLSEGARIWCGSHRAAGCSVVRVPLSWLRHHIRPIVRCRTWWRDGGVGGYGHRGNIFTCSPRPSRC